MMYLEFKEEDIKEARRLLKHYKDGFPKALYRAINKALAGGKSEMLDLLKQRYNFKATAVSKRMKINKCSSYKTLNATIRSTGKGFHLTDVLQTRKTKKGLMVSVKKSTGRLLIPHAFKNFGKNSGKIIAFIREERDGKMASRYPIAALYASHPEVVYNTPENWSTLQKAIQKDLDKKLMQEIDTVLRGY